MLRLLREMIRHREFILLSLGVAAWIIVTPLQHEIALSRFQHYALGVLAVATGFLLQAVISWRGHSKWGRSSLIASALYLSAFGFVIFQNPWLDGNFDLQTQAQDELRPRFAIGFLIAGFVVSFFWANWMEESRTLAKLQKAKERELA